MALHILLGAEARGGGPGSILFSMDYHSANFGRGEASENIRGLNCPFDTTIGPVDADWMLRTALYGAAGDPGVAQGTFYAAKAGWNIRNGTAPWAEMGDASYRNAPDAATLFVLGYPLRQLFDPARRKCLPCSAK
ncbi:MAG: hypothetical protein ACXWHZ_02655 [Usitatibacter sp.]